MRLATEAQSVAHGYSAGFVTDAGYEPPLTRAQRSLPLQINSEGATARVSYP